MTLFKDKHVQFPPTTGNGACETTDASTDNDDFHGGRGPVSD